EQDVTGPVSGANDLGEVELDGGLAPEDGHEHLQLAALGVDLGDHAGEVGEGASGDLDHVTDVEGDAYLGRLARARDPDAGEHALLLLGGEGHGAGRGADEAGDAGRVAHDLPGLVGLVGVVAQVHLHEDVAGEQLAGGLFLLAPAHALDRDVGGHHHLVDAVGHAERLGPVQDVLLGLLLVPYVGVNRVPLVAHGLPSVNVRS